MFLLTVLLATGTGSIDPAPPGQVAQPVIDMHLHAGPGKPDSRYYTPRDGESADAARRRTVFDELERNGVVAGILGGPPADVERYRKLAPIALIGAVAFPCSHGVDPNLQPCFADGGDWPDLDWLRAEVQAGRIGALGELYNVYAGIPVDDPRMAPYLALAAELDVLVLAHADSGPPPRGRVPGCCPAFDGALGDPAHWQPVLQRHPGLRLVLYHAFRPEFVTSAIALMDRYPGVMVETSPMTLAPRALVHAALQRYVEAGHADRIVFGSDYIGSIAGALEVIASAPLDAAHKRAILHDNAARFLRETRDGRN